MTTTPTPEEFLAQPSEPDEDPYEAPAYDLGQPEHAVGPADPLESIAASLGLIASLAQRRVTADVAPHLEAYANLEQRHADLEAEYDAQTALIAEILAVCKPSVSKLANQVRDTVAAWREGTAADPAQETVEPEPGSDLVQPADDADVVEWREYAVACGSDPLEVVELNRSQIRTLLGLPQPVGGA